MLAGIPKDAPGCLHWSHPCLPSRSEIHPNSQSGSTMLVYVCSSPAIVSGGSQEHHTFQMLQVRCPPAALSSPWGCGGRTLRKGLQISYCFLFLPSSWVSGPLQLGRWGVKNSVKADLFPIFGDQRHMAAAGAERLGSRDFDLCKRRHEVIPTFSFLAV